MLLDVKTGRRGLIVAGAGLALASCAKGGAAKGDDEGEDVVATEDLMREHGVLRRLLVIYREAAAAIAANATAFDAAQLAKATALFQRFGEDYHERQLEEQHVFPQVLKAGGAAAGLVPALIAQHARGRQITAYVQSKCAGGKIGAGDAGPLAKALDSFARMYEPHAAYEDTIVFQAWKKSLSKGAFHDLSDQFEDIERRTFGGDGFDMAVGEVDAIEKALGLNDLARYTPQAPA